MKIIVDELPIHISECMFAEYYDWGNYRCKLCKGNESNASYCFYDGKCPYLTTLNEMVEKTNEN